MEDYLTRRPKCEFPGCGKDAIGVISYPENRIACFRMWCCEDHNNNNAFMPIEETNAWEMMQKGVLR